MWVPSVQMEGGFISVFLALFIPEGCGSVGLGFCAVQLKCMTRNTVVVVVSEECCMIVNVFFCGKKESVLHCIAFEVFLMPR